MAEDTFKIAKGKIKTELEEKAENLRFTIEEGYSDQDTLFWAKSICDELNELEKVI